ncbi:uncharacterized protein [Dermacentor albipictus]|uniref:uncharacterized protein isoform X2 n=1 Tax=Dermacentor albipictus TaxID=60249 RepID=UPI0038FCFE8A
MGRQYDGSLHPVEWAILEANRQLAEEAQKPPLYLQAFLDMVHLTIGFISCCAKDERFIRRIVEIKGEDGLETDYLDYMVALFSYEPLLGAVVVLALALFLGSVFCGLFFVLMRMVGAFGGRKVQNITGYYMLALRLHTVTMTLLAGLNIVSLAWLYGSATRLVTSHENSVKVMHEGHNFIKSRILEGLNELKTSVETARSSRKGIADLISKSQAEYLNQLQKHVGLILEKSGLPSEEQVTDISNFCKDVTKDKSVPQDQRTKFDTCATACADLMQAVKDASNAVMSELRMTVEEYNRAGTPAFRELQPGTSWNSNKQKLATLYSEVKAKDFPTMSDFGILALLNPYGDIFERGLSYGSNACIAAFVLQMVVAFSFIVGAWVHDAEVPPNKRSLISNQTGITLVVSTFFMWLFTTVLVPSTILYMLSGVIAAKYLCMPYEYNGAEGLQLLDNVTAALYIKGKWDPIENQDYELYNTTYKPGQVISKCNGTTPLVHLSTHPDITVASMMFTTHGYPMYLKSLEEKKALTVSTSFALPSGLAVKLNDAKNALDNLSSLNVSSAGVSARWTEGFAALSSDAAYRNSLQASMNKEYLEYTNESVRTPLSQLDFTRKALRITSLKRFPVAAVFSSVGDCKPLRDFYVQCLQVFCDGTLQCMNGIWFAVWMVCGMFTTQIAVGLKLSKYLMKMDDYLYEGVEVEESVESPEDDKSTGFSVSYAPSGFKAPTGQYKWRRPVKDPEGKFLKFEENPYHMPKELEGSVTGFDSNESGLDLRRWNVDRKKEFVIESIADELKRVKEARAKGQQLHVLAGDGH